VYQTYLRDLENFVNKRLRDGKIKLAIPQLNHKGVTSRRKLVEILEKENFTTCHWTKERLDLDRIKVALRELAFFHAAGFVFRMNLKDNLCKIYPWLKEDLHSTYFVKELLTKYLDSYLQYLSHFINSKNVVKKLRDNKNHILKLISSLRKPKDNIGSRFLTVCHGDLWMGNLMFRESHREANECLFLDFHSVSLLNPSTDLANLLLTSCDKNFIIEKWEILVKEYFEIFSSNVQKFGILPKHLGINYTNFALEAEKALVGQLLCLVIVTPILVMFGPKHKKRGSHRKTSERETTVKHIIQMMTIAEEESDEEEETGEPRMFAKEWLGIEHNDKLRGSIEMLIDIANHFGFAENIERFSQENA